MGPLAGPEWSAKPVYAAYKEIENFYGPTTHPETHGYHGLMAIRAGIPDSKATPDFIDAVKTTLNPPIIDDYNYPKTPIGLFTNWQYFEFPDSTRASASRTFLNPYVIDKDGKGQHGRRLQVLTQTTATGVIWSKKHPTKVKGAIVLHKGKPLRIRARKEVIVSLGLNSPAFLQVVGIGPADVLANAGVPVRVNNPAVGTNLYCYPYITLTLVCPPGVENNTDPATLNVAGALFPDPRPGKDPNFLNFKFQPLIYADGAVNLMIITIEAPLLPKSRGTIKIQDADPLKIASVQLGLLDDPDDLAMILACAQYVTPVIESLAAKGYTPIAPTIAQLQDPAYMTTYIQSTVGNTYHYQSSNRMTKTREEGGVVDPWGHVYGVKHLMVVDNSIAPTGTNGNPNGTAEMMAYRIGKHLTRC